MERTFRHALFIFRLIAVICLILAIAKTQLKMIERLTNGEGSTLFYAWILAAVCWRRILRQTNGSRKKCLLRNLSTAVLPIE